MPPRGGSRWLWKVRSCKGQRHSCCLLVMGPEGTQVSEVGGLRMVKEGGGGGRVSGAKSQAACDATWRGRASDLQATGATAV